MVELDFELAVMAGKTTCELNKKKQECSLADAIVLSTVRVTKGKVVTGYEHFRNLPEVIFIK